jgi:hypothetical protein
MPNITVHMYYLNDEATKARVKELAQKYPGAWIFVDGKTAYSPASGGKFEKGWG